jgi:hypothetical protein
MRFSRPGNQARRTRIVDYLLLMAAFASCFFAVIFAARSPGAGLLTHLFAWTAGPYFAGWFIKIGAKTDALSPTRWNGDVETGPVTLFAMVLAMALPVILNWEQTSYGNGPG